MKIAISTDGVFVSAHFGRCPSFTLIDINKGKAEKKEVINNPGHEPGFLPEFLKNKGVTHIIAGGMGQRALMLFEQSGIKPVLGVSGEIDDVVKKSKKALFKAGRACVIRETARVTV